MRSGKRQKEGCREEWQVGLRQKLCTLGSFLLFGYLFLLLKEKSEGNGPSMMLMGAGCRYKSTVFTRW